MREQKCAVMAMSRVMNSVAAPLLLHHRLQKIEHLRLHRHIEAAGGVVGDHEPRRAGQCDGDHDALRHAARQLVREGASRRAGSGMRTARSISSATSLRLACGRCRGDRARCWRSAGQPSAAEFSSARGFGITIAISRPSRPRRASVSMARRSRPANETCPRSTTPGGGTRPMMARASVVLPDAGFAHQAYDLARCDLKVETLQRMESAARGRPETRPRGRPHPGFGRQHPCLSPASADRARNRADRRRDR